MEKDAQDFKIMTYISVPSYDIFYGYLYSHTQYDIDLINGSSANTSVMFLSGTNIGKSFDAVYNPD